MKFTTGLILGVAALSLAACGGGTGGGGGTTPPPGGGGGATSNTSLNPLTVSETFPTTAGTIAGNRTPTHVVTGVTSDQGGISNDVRLIYDHSAGTYRMVVSQNNVTADTTFGPTESGSTSLVRRFAKSISGGEETLRLLRPGGNGTTTGSGLDYVSYGGWQTIVAGASSSQDFQATFFTYGVRTPTTSMPTTGNASYNTIVDGYWTKADGLFSLVGTVGVTANFQTGDVSGAFDLGGRREPDHDLNPTFGTLTGSATISGNTFGGSVTGVSGAASTYSGSWNGGFFGPSAQEVGGSFQLSEPGNTNNQAVGVFVGK